MSYYDVLLDWLFCSVLFWWYCVLCCHVALCHVVWCSVVQKMIRGFSRSLYHSLHSPPLSLYNVPHHFIQSLLSSSHLFTSRLFSSDQASLLLFSFPSLSFIIPHALCTPPTHSPSSPSCYLHLMLSLSATQTCLRLVVEITC